MTHDEVAFVRKLQDAEAAMPDAADLTTDRQRADHYEKKCRLQITASRIQNLQPNKRTRKLADAHAARLLVVDAQQKIADELEDAPDWRTIADRRDQNKAWGRHTGLIASRRALVNGVEFFSGVPAVPAPLKQIFGVMLLPDGREFPHWPGCLTEIDEEIARLTPIENQRIEALADAVREAHELLSVPV